MAHSSQNLFSKSKDSETVSESSGANRKKPGRNLSWLLPIFLVGGFLLTVWLLFGDRLLPARELETSTVAVLPSGAGEDSTDSGTPLNPWEASVLFQASGWVEPDPFPIRATALTHGVIDEVLVLEGETVAKDQVLATLIDEDARLSLASAQAGLGEAQAELRIAEARLNAAQQALESRRNRAASAKARLAELKDDADRLDRIGSEAVSAGEIRRAALRVDAQQAVLNAREAEIEEWQAELSALETAIERAEQRVNEAEVLRDERQLALDRTRITSPVDGVVQRLLAAPGQKKMLAMDNPESATIAILYDPESLQARIDVPLEQAASLAVGQAAWVRSNLLPDERFRGRVTRIVGEADLQRNTLQAKVELLDTDPRLRPEMLCRAEFLADGQADPDPSARSPGGLVLYVPSSALVDLSDADAAVWIVSPEGETARKTRLTLGQTERDGFREVREGLRPGQRIVLNPPPTLKEGERIRPVPTD